MTLFGNSKFTKAVEIIERLLRESYQSDVQLTAIESCGNKEDDQRQLNHTNAWLLEKARRIGEELGVSIDTSYIVNTMEEASGDE